MLAKVEKEKEQKDGYKVSTPTYMANTPSGIVMAADRGCHQRKTSDSAPITETQIVKKDPFLVMLVGVEMLEDVGGAFLNNPASLMLFVWMLPH